MTAPSDPAPSNKPTEPDNPPTEAASQAPDNPPTEAAPSPAEAGAQPEADNPPTLAAKPSGEPRARIIRRAPTGPLPAIPAPEPRTTQFPHRATPLEATERAKLPAPLPDPGVTDASPRSAVAASSVSIFSGWATSVVSTELIAGWWSSDRLFCVAVGFLALVFAVTTIAGVIMLLLRRHLGRYLVMTGSVVALLTYLGVFIAGARVSWLVHSLPLLPIASLALTLLPETKRWAD